MTNPSALTLTDPLDVDEGRAAARVLAHQRRDAQSFYEHCVEAAAGAERAYRRALATAYVNQAGKEGTAAHREAQARAEAADAAYARDVADGMVRVALERLRGLEGERAMLRVLLDWSARRDPTGWEQQGEQPQWSGTRGAA